MSNEKSQKTVRFRKGKVVYKKNESHPRVMISKDRKSRRITNAKLHLVKPGEKREDVIYFSHNPNPLEKEKKGSFYSKLRHDEPNKFYETKELEKWKVPRDGMKKMKARDKAQKEAAKQYHKKKAMQKQVPQARRQNTCQRNLCINIKSFFRRLFKRGKKEK